VFVGKRLGASLDRLEKPDPSPQPTIVLPPPPSLSYLYFLFFNSFLLGIIWKDERGRNIRGIK
jgi:hypothetical protein